MPGLSAAEYLVQSLLDPEAYVVSGYPPVMIAARDAPIELTVPPPYNPCIPG
ncbi:MAG: hypothetical protein GY719_41285 [bacterium]|nr:hypothetical protein [bacterium]